MHVKGEELETEKRRRRHEQSKASSSSEYHLKIIVTTLQSDHSFAEKKILEYKPTVSLSYRKSKAVEEEVVKEKKVCTERG